MDKENIKLAHESITSIVRSAIEKGNMSLADIAELTQNLKNIFLPEEDFSLIGGGEPFDDDYGSNESENIIKQREPYIDENGLKVITRPFITFQELKEGRKHDKDFCKWGAVIVDQKNTYDEKYIICLEDLAPKKMLTSYLKRKFNLTPTEYREKWGLRDDYPMLTQSLTETRRKNGKLRKKNNN